MIDLFEVDLGELLPPASLAKISSMRGEWALFRLQLRIYGDLVVAAYSHGTIWFNHWHNKCCPVTVFDLVQYIPSLSRRFSSTSTFGFMAYETALALQNCG